MEDQPDSPDCSESELDAERGKRRPNLPTPTKRTRNELSTAEKSASNTAKVFQSTWLYQSEFKGWLERVPGNETMARCWACQVNFKCGKSELRKHTAGKKHSVVVKDIKQSKKIDEILNSESIRLQQNVKKAEVSLSAFFAEHNVAIPTAEHLVGLMKKCFPDSEIAQNISLDRTKCTAILQNVVAKTEQEEIAEDLKSTPFSILVDESTDVSNVKNMCVIVKYIAPGTGRLRTRLLDLVELDAKDCSADALFNKFKEALKRYDIPMKNIIGLGCDNAAVMIGAHNSFANCLKEECPWVVIFGCICHSSALASRKACSTLPSNVDSFLRAVTNYISGSPKRCAILEEFQEFFKQEKLKLLKPARTRWLVLHPCVVRLLNNWDVLKTYFELCCFEDPKDMEAHNILDSMKSPFIKRYFLFLRYTLDYFNNLNAMFQSAEVVVHKLFDSSFELLQQLCQNYMRQSALGQVVSINVADPLIQLELNDIYLGPGVEDLLASIAIPKDPTGKMTKEQLETQRKGDIKTFRLRCLDFYISAAKEIQTRLPLRDPRVKK